ncbi:MAG TPA: helix-turn-helix domain-containing GNAT family N-acetyltransferase [Silvibacterium sp.]|nr:helix-turn-helix domain-containing GNAT family N-acetyltransferase [Silvibacterium sp.]
MLALDSEITDSHITAFRRFNRCYTRKIGTLREGLLDSEFSLTEARVIYELATREELTAGEIVRELDLDAGYLSRILRKLEEVGLLKRKASLEDARQAILTMTRRGREAFADLNERSNRQARSILEAVPASKLPELLHAMRTMEEILSPAPERAPYILRNHRPGDMGWVVYRQGVLYAQEYGWDETYEALASRVVADFVEGYDPGRDRCWIAERDGVPLGCIFLVHHPELTDTAKLRLLHVEAQVRGLGLGKALVGECMRFARAAGYRKVTLWTQSILTAAQHIYRQAGFRLVREEPHHSFGADLIAQTWEREL